MGGDRSDERLDAKPPSLPRSRLEESAIGLMACRDEFLTLRKDVVSKLVEPF